MARELNDQELVRRQKMEELRAKGIDPFGQAYVRNSNSKSIKEGFFFQQRRTGKQECRSIDCRQDHVQAQDG